MDIIFVVILMSHWSGTSIQHLDMHTMMCELKRQTAGITMHSPLCWSIEMLLAIYRCNTACGMRDHSPINVFSPLSQLFCLVYC